MMLPFRCFCGGNCALCKDASKHVKGIWKVYRCLVYLIVVLTLSLPQTEMVTFGGKGKEYPCDGFGESGEEKRWYAHVHM